MALRLLLSNRFIIPQLTSLTRFYRCYTSFSYENRSINSSLTISNASLHCQQFKSNRPLLSAYQPYFYATKFSSSDSNSSPPSSSSNDDNSSFSSSNDGKSSNDNNNNNNNNNNSNDETADGIDAADNRVPVVLQSGSPLMSVEVPEIYPIVPLIPVTRHPLFPKFIKMLEITNKDLIELIRRKVKLNQPYAGIFLRKESEKTTTDIKPPTPELTKEKEKLSSTVSSDVIKNLDEIYQIGSFVQIHEVHDMGDRLRMIVMAHRRIKIVGIVPDDLAAIEEIDRRRPSAQTKTNGNRRRQRRKG